MKKIFVFWGIMILICPMVVKSQVLVSTVDETFSGVTSIDVKGIFCSVELEAGATANVTLVGEIRAIKPYDDLKIKYTHRGNTLTVWVEIPPHITGQTKGFLRFTVPRNVLLKVENTSGKIVVNGIGSETISLTTTAGSINANNIPCNAVLSSMTGAINCKTINGNMMASSTSGNIHAKGVKGFARIYCTTGSVNLDGVANEANVITTTGTQFISGAHSNVSASASTGRIELAGVKGIIKATTTTGNITINDASGEIEATTESGAIKGHSVMVTGNSNFEGGSGNIEIELLNPSKTLSYNLKSTRGKLEAENIRETKNLIVNQGATKITGTTTSGSQRYYRR